MTFKVSDQHVHEFYQNGYTVFRRVLPPRLIADLRRVTDRGRDLARAGKNGQVQRFQPVSDFDIDQKPFEDYANLPELREAIGRVLTPRHVYGNLKWLGVLIEPDALPYSTAWHRDARAQISDENEWKEMLNSYEMGNQVNCPLWEDSSTWFVPGSQLRADLACERDAFEKFPPGKPVNVSKSEGFSSEEREQICLDYCRRMPGAIPLHLNAGDFALYRPYGWHLGNYLPYKKRATLHDGVWVPEAGERWMRRLKELNETARLNKAA